MPPKKEMFNDWDCPQVRAVVDYDSQQADELTLFVGDIINIT